MLLKCNEITRVSR